MSNIIIFDTTLRDGEQSPGATMTLKEKLAIAELLDQMGVDVIEAGFAAASPGDMECIAFISQLVKNAAVCSLARAVKSDIEAAARSLEKAKNPRIHTFISTSKIHIEHQFRMSQEKVLEVIDESVRFAHSLCDNVEWCAMDATRSDIDFLIQAIEVAIQAGAKTINVPDTVGYSLPSEYGKLMAILAERFPDAILSAHCHDDLGLATANSLAGILGGARQVECTINGIGERAGNAAMEEIVMAMKTRSDLLPFKTNIDTRKFFNISRFVSAVTGFAVQKNKAIVGANAFSHESGIHQDGMLKNRNTYEIISPETVGMAQSQIVFGKHSGRAALKNKASEWGIHLSEEELKQVFDNFKALCDRKKHVSEEDVMAIIHDQQSLPQHPFITLSSFKTEQLAQGSYVAEVAVIIKNSERKSSGNGDGPLDAILKAINNILGSIKINLLNFEVHSISHGTDAQTEANIALECEGNIFSGHARDTDMIMAATRAYISAMNKILAREGKLRPYDDMAAAA